MAIEALRDFVGEWELELPGTGRIRGHVVFEDLGDVLVQRTAIPNFFRRWTFASAMSALLAMIEPKSTVSGRPRPTGTIGSRISR